MSRTPGRTILTREQFRELAHPLIGMPVSHSWRGAGSAIFLELGALTTHTRTGRKRGEYTYHEGEVGLMLEWSWRVEGHLIHQAPADPKEKARAPLDVRMVSRNSASH